MAKKLLIIDDEKNIHTTLGRGLELEGFEVLHAFSCAEGVEKISVHCPELVLLDLKLGDGTGLEVLIKVKGLEHQPVIGMVFAMG